MSRTSRVITSVVARTIVAGAALFFALDLIAFSILFGLVGFFSEIARPIAITAAVIFSVCGLMFLVAAVCILFVRHSTFTEKEADDSLTRTERLAAMVVGSMGGVLVGIVAFMALWIGQGSIDYALISFHASLLLFAIGSYTWPKAIPEISLEVVDFCRQLVSGIL